MSWQSQRYRGGGPPRAEECRISTSCMWTELISHHIDDVHPDRVLAASRYIGVMSLEHQCGIRVPECMGPYIYV